MTGNFRSVAELISILALAGGLVLVALQIQQSSEITKVQLDASVTGSWHNIDGTRQSEQFAQVLAKSIQQPQELTLAELLELDAYYQGVVDQMEVYAELMHRGYREGTLQGMFQANVPLYFSNSFAKAWWHRKSAYYDGDWPVLLTAAVEATDPQGQADMLRGILEDLEKSR